MSSRIKHIVEPALGWSFVLTVIVVLVGAMLFATRPAEMEITRRIPVERSH